MRITREIFDNDKLIMHVNYDRIDLAKLRKKVQTPNNVLVKPVQQNAEQPSAIKPEEKEDK